MSMISFVFFGLVAILYLILYLINRNIENTEKSILISNAIILIASYIFVIYADIRFALFLAFVSISTWICVNKNRYTLGCLIALGALGYAKYINFFAESFASLFKKDYVALNIILPLGISFYSFSAISYIVDVKRKKIEKHSLFDVALYLSFFPKLTSGPIQKSADFFEQSCRRRDIGWNNFEAGIQIFVFGLFKKIVLADRLSLFVDQVYDAPKAFGSATVFLAVIAYSLQIYFDFSGYSDMAIGTARIIGFEMPKNFNLPYLSHNVTEFWKRWHITLSSWLQEYVYIGLGGNRKGKIRGYLNLLLTMLIGGIWHGANWTYIFWGLLSGIALVIHKMWIKCTKSDQRKASTMGSAIAIISTFMFHSFSCIFFRAKSLSHAFTIIRRIFAFEAGLQQPYAWFFVAALVLICASFIAHRRTSYEDGEKNKTNVSRAEGFYPTVKLTSFWGMVTFFVFVGLTLCFAYTGGSPFIYGKY